MPTASSLRRREDRLGDVLYRRARHVITENQRVQVAVMALRAGGLKTVGQALRDSHASLRDDYEVSCVELDVIVETGERAARLLRRAHDRRRASAGARWRWSKMARWRRLWRRSPRPIPRRPASRRSLYVCQAAAGSGVERL